MSVVIIIIITIHVLTYFSNRTLFNATIFPFSVLIALKTTPYVPERTEKTIFFLVAQNKLFVIFRILQFTFANFFNALKIIYVTHDEPFSLPNFSHLFKWYLV